VWCITCRPTLAACCFLEKPSRQYTLTGLPDLAGVRVSAFPKSRLEEVHRIIRDEYGEWTPDPVRTVATSRVLAWKYHGYTPAGPRVRAELQGNLFRLHDLTIMHPELTGLWNGDRISIRSPAHYVNGGAGEMTRPARVGRRCAGEMTSSGTNANSCWFLSGPVAGLSPQQAYGQV
jgi:hypothetical protein